MIFVQMLVPNVRQARCEIIRGRTHGTLQMRVRERSQHVEAR